MPSLPDPTPGYFSLIPVHKMVIQVTILVFTFLNALRVFVAFELQGVLEKYSADVAYIVASGAFWVVIGLVNSYLFFTKNRHTGRVTSAVSVFYFAWYWFDRVFIQSTPSVNHVFSLGVSIVGLVYILLLINSRQYRSVFSKETG